MDPIDATGAARMLGRSRAWFYAHLDELAKRGFPEPLPISRRWDPDAIDAWKARFRRTGDAVRAYAEDAGIDSLFGL